MNNKGYILFIGLWIATVLFIFLTILTTKVFIQRRQVDYSYHREKAFALAESGVDAALACLNEKNLSRPYPAISGTIPGMGRFLVQISSSADKVEITSTGYAQKGSKVTSKVTLEVIARQDTGFDYAIATQGDLKLEDKITKVEGNVFSIGNILNEGVPVTGKGYATQDISGEEYFTEGVEEGVEPVSFPQVDFSLYESQATTVINGDFTVSDNPDFVVPDILYVRGDFKAENSTLKGPGLVVAEGSIKLEENSTCGASGAPVGLISRAEDPKEAIKIEVKSDLYGFIYAPYGGVKIETEGRVYGCIIGGKGVDVEVKIETGAGVFYRNYYAGGLTRLPPVEGGYVINRWRYER